jgi:hypothetical protein
VWEIPPEHAKLLAELRRLEKVKQNAQKEFESARSALEKVGDIRDERPSASRDIRQDLSCSSSNRLSPAWGTPTGTLFVKNFKCSYDDVKSSFQHLKGFISARGTVIGKSGFHAVFVQFFDVSCSIEAIIAMQGKPVPHDSVHRIDIEFAKIERNYIETKSDFDIRSGLSITAKNQKEQHEEPPHLIAVASLARCKQEDSTCQNICDLGHRDGPASKRQRRDPGDAPDLSVSLVGSAAREVIIVRSDGEKAHSRSSLQIVGSDSTLKNHPSASVRNEVSGFLELYRSPFGTVTRTWCKHGNGCRFGSNCVYGHEMIERSQSAHKSGRIVELRTPADSTSTSLSASLGSAKHAETDPNFTVSKATSHAREPHSSQKGKIDANITMKKNETLLEADVSSKVNAAKRQKITDMRSELDAMSVLEVPMS